MRHRPASPDGKLASEVVRLLSAGAKCRRRGRVSSGFITLVEVGQKRRSGSWGMFMMF